MHSSLITLPKILALWLGLLLTAGPLLAESIQGRITSMSNKAKVIQVDLGKSQVSFQFDEKTQWVKASSIKDLMVNDMIKVELGANQVARVVERKVLSLPPGQEIGVAELQGLLAQGKGFVLIDSRPSERYQEGHLPQAISLPVEDLAKNPKLLPGNPKDLLVFYCGGPT